jgi:hypothetical protein
MNNITLVFEDEPTYQVMLKILAQSQYRFSEIRSIPCSGFGKIKRNIIAYNKAAKHGFYFIITDLDRYDCAPALIDEWLPDEQNPQLLFRIAVHEIESWLLADRNNFASYLSVNRALIPLNPDDIPDPKQTIINLARKSRKRQIREGIPPIDKYASIGPGYNIEFRNFITNHWDISNASNHSQSLARAIRNFNSAIPQQRD